MTKREKVSLWRGRIERAKEKRKAFFEGTEDCPGADFGIAAYRGELKPEWWSPSDPFVVVNKTKSAIRAALPSLLYANPEFRVYPAAVDMEETGVDVAYERARAKELWVNHVWKETEGTTHARIAIQNAFFSLGVLKCGYRCHFQDDTKRGVFKRTEDGEYVLDENGDPTLARGEFLLDETGEVLRDEYGIPITHPGSITKEEWFIEAVDPRMMLFDCDGGPDFFQHRYVIEEWCRPLTEVKDDPRFSAAARKRLVASEAANGPGSQRKSVFETAHRYDADNTVVEKDEEMLRGYDIYCFQTGEYMVLPECGVDEENDEFLLIDAIPPGLEHGPYRFLKFTEDAGTEWYPIPDAIDMALVNQEYCITRSQMMIHRDHTKTRYLEAPGAFEGEGVDAEEERAKFAHGPDGTLIKVSNINAIQPAPKAQLDSSFMQAIPNIAADFNEVGGMPGEVRGVADADTATQASILASGAETRNNDRRDNQVQKFLCEVARALLMSGQANAELDSLVIEKVVESAGVAPFKARRLTPPELLGEFEVTLSIGSTLPKNDPRTLNNLMNLLNALAQNPALGQFKGLMRRVLDGLGLDPLLAEEIYEIAVVLTQQVNGGDAATPAQSGQVLGDDLMGMLGNMAGGSQTGAPVN